jgi:hypothetical protein
LKSQKNTEKKITSYYPKRIFKIWSGGEGEQGGEMTQTMYAHVNK